MFESIGKQVVILKNPKSKVFEEAIFIVKDGVNHPPRDLLQECERIINEQTRSFKREKNAKKTALIISIISAIILSSIILTITLNLM